MEEERIHVAEPRRIAGRFLGGFVPAVAYHYGVLEVLEERGFRLRKGFLGSGEERETGPPGLDFVAGSSAGAFFVTAACADVGPTELVGAVRELPAEVAPFQSGYLGQGDGFTSKWVGWLRGGPRPRWKNRRSWKSWAAESMLNALFPLWDLQAIERYLREEVLRERDWTDLRTEAAILAVDLNHPVTYVVGERESPIIELFRRHPVEAEAIHRILGSEGHKIVEAFEAAGIDRDHPVLEPFVARPLHRNTWIQIRDVAMSCAAVGSMATFPFYKPVPFMTRDGEPYRLGHYNVVVEDGEDRNPFATDVAEQSGADLVIVSSISAPYKYLHGLGSLAQRGYSAMHHQKTAHSRDAKQEAVKTAHAQQRRLFEASKRVLEEEGCSKEVIERLRKEFHEVAWIDNVRIRIYPDSDVPAENHILRHLDPLAFTPESIQRAHDLGRMVAERVLHRYRFEFLD